MTGAPLPLVAHVIYRLDIGGLQNGLVNLINSMPPDRFRHVVVCLAGYSREFASRIKRDDVEIVSLDKKPGKDLAVYWRFYQVLRRLRPSIVHTRNFGTVDLQWIARLAGVPCRIHGEHGWEASDPKGSDRKRLLIRRICRAVVHRYVPMSADLARWLSREVGVPEGRVRQVCNGVDTDRFSPSSSAGRTETVIVGTVGRLDPVKNQRQLISAFARVVRSSSSGEALRLLIVGDGPARGDLEQQVAELDIGKLVEFASAADDVPRLMRRINLFVLPSINEGISNTILEAMACGLPVVAGRVGGNPELIVEEETGVLYDAHSDDELAAALTRYVSDEGLRERHGQAGRIRALNGFSLDAMVAGYLRVYEECLGRTYRSDGSMSAENMHNQRLTEG